MDPIVVSSLLSREIGGAQKALLENCGAVGVLEKPFDVRDVLLTVRRALVPAGEEAAG